MVGLSLSVTETVNEQLSAGVENVFVVVPGEKAEPEGRPLVCVTVQTPLVGVA
jgi:hypothetical protein